MDLTAITLIQDLIEADLQLAWEHLQDGREELAEHELCNALAKIAQIKELKRQAAEGELPFTALNASNPTLDLLIEAHPTHDQTQSRR